MAEKSPGGLIARTAATSTPGRPIRLGGTGRGIQPPIQPITITPDSNTAGKPIGVGRAPPRW